MIRDSVYRLPGRSPDQACTSHGVRRIQRLEWSGRPLANAPCTVRELPNATGLTTDGGGRLSIDAPVTAEAVTVVFTDPPISQRLRVGYLDPVSVPSGVAHRLANLGHLRTIDSHAGDIDDQELATAIRRFQRSRGLPITGEVDETTRAKLVECTAGDTEPTRRSSCSCRRTQRRGFSRKRDALRAQPTFRQSLVGDIDVTLGDEGSAVATFTKLSGQADKMRSVQGRLVLETGDGGPPTIVEESDGASDARRAGTERTLCEDVAARAVGDLPSVQRAVADARHSAEQTGGDAHYGSITPRRRLCARWRGPASGDGGSGPRWVREGSTCRSCSARSTSRRRPFASSTSTSRQGSGGRPHPPLSANRFLSFSMKSTRRTTLSMARASHLRKWVAYFRVDACRTKPTAPRCS